MPKSVTGQISGRRLNFWTLHPAVVVMQSDACRCRVDVATDSPEELRRLVAELLGEVARLREENASPRKRVKNAVS
jgi:hypothetical protein